MNFIVIKYTETPRIYALLSKSFTDKNLFSKFGLSNAFSGQKFLLMTDPDHDTFL